MYAYVSTRVSSRISRMKALVWKVKHEYLQPNEQAMVNIPPKKDVEAVVSSVSPTSE